MFLLLALVAASLAEEVSVSVNGATLARTPSGYSFLADTPGHTWLRGENTKRVSYYENLAWKLLGDAKSLASKDDDPFMPLWEATNQLVLPLSLCCHVHDGMTNTRCRWP